MTRAEMLSRISSEELTEWQAYYLVEPFGQMPNAYGHAITAATIANGQRQKGKKAAKVEDFIPKFEAKKEKSPEEMLNAVVEINAMFGGQDLREEFE